MKVPMLVDFGDFVYDIREIRGFGKGGAGHTWVQCGDIRHVAKLPYEDVAKRILKARLDAQTRDDE